MKKNRQPLVSVIMPVYNAADFVVEAVESILAQTYQNLELIIVNDASTDQTGRLLSQYPKRYPGKIRLVSLRKNRGQGGDAAANVGYRLAQGKYLARMDADDIALPERITKQVSFMEKNPQYSVVGSQAYVINDRGETVGEKTVPLTHQKIYKDYFVFHPMINPTLMFRKEGLSNPDRFYLQDQPTNNDYLTLIKMIAAGARFANLEEKLLYYRVHDRNDSLARVRRTFKHSLITRLRAVLEFGYRPTLSGWLKLVLQVGLVYALPERAVFQLYQLMRGTNKFKIFASIYSLFRLERVRKLFRPASLESA